MIARLLIVAGLFLTGAGVYKTFTGKKKAAACPSGAEGAASGKLPAFKPEAGAL